ncbi:MAG: GNAT family N-acetyltransferase [Bacteroidota bacterium]
MVNIREATVADCNAIFDLITELAIFEKAPEMVINTPEQLRLDGFGPNPLYICFVAESDDTIVGMSFCYIRYSTWVGRVLYLEDLIVTESKRHLGIGSALLEHTIQYGKANNFKRVSWQVLDWNTPAIEFYKKYNAGFDPEWLNAWITL